MQFHGCSVSPKEPYELLVPDGECFMMKQVALVEPAKKGGAAIVAAVLGKQVDIELSLGSVQQFSGVAQDEEVDLPVPEVTTVRQ